MIENVKYKFKTHCNFITNFLKNQNRNLKMNLFANHQWHGNNWIHLQFHGSNWVQWTSKQYIYKLIGAIDSKFKLSLFTKFVTHNKI